MYSDLKIALTYRTGNSTGPSTKRERFFYDFIIDGKSLLKKFLGNADMIGCFSQAIDSSEVYSQLLCLSTPTLLSGRVLLYNCPECGDIGCGAIACKVSRAENTYVWSDFAYENGYSEPDPLGNVGPFTFKAEQYENVLRSVLNGEAPSI